MADVSPPLSTTAAASIATATATATSTIYLSMSGSETGTATSSAFPASKTPAQGSLDSAGAGITGGYTGDSLPLKIIIAFLLGLALYNAIELIVLAFVTFQRYRGLYFWSLVVSAFGIIPYALGFIIKFFQLLDPYENVGYVAVVLLTLGWWSMVSGQSVVLWSRLHLVTNSRRVLRWTLYMIICNGIVLHSITTVLTFGSNSNSVTRPTLQRFVRGYSIMEKTQMVGFFIQETILSVIYIKETIRLLRLSEAVQDEARSFDNSATTPNNNMGSGGVNPHLKQASVRKTMYQLLAINVLIIAMDLALLAVEFASLYLIETTLKGVVYSIKLKLEFAVLGKLIQLVRDRAESDHSLNPASAHFYNGNGNGYAYGGGGGSNTGAGDTLGLEKTASSSDDTHHHHHNGSTKANSQSNETAPNTTAAGGGRILLNGNPLSHDFCVSAGTQYPDFVDPRRLNSSSSVTHAAEHYSQVCVSPGWETRVCVDDDCGGGGFGEAGLGTGQERWRRRSRVKKGSWIDEEMDKFNIG